jgi:hypothetical protein
MLLLSGYTLGFFFPRRAKGPAAEPGQDIVPKPSAEQSDPGKFGPAGERPDRAEVPASLYFFRYF